MSQSAITVDPVPEASEQGVSGSTWLGLRLNTWLAWKEMRQVAPLVMSLAAVMLALLLMHDPWDNGPFGSEMAEFLHVLFPGLFATGAGALLVGQERSTRTIEWLSLLPITPRSIWLSKLGAGLVGLAMMWIISLLLLSLYISSADYWFSNNAGFSGWFAHNPHGTLMFHSFFVLMCGFFTSWRIKNPFYAILAIVPLACLPFFATTVALIFLDDNRPGASTQAHFLWGSLATYAILVPSIAYLSYRSALRTLSPARAPGARVEQLADMAWPDRSPVSVPRFRTHTAPIIWQSIHGSRGMLSLLSATLLVTIPLVCWCLLTPTTISGYGPDTRTTLVLSLFVLPLAVSWLGVCVFKNDGAAERLRFLADRGVSPVKMWMARQAVPLAIAISGLLLYVLLTVLAPRPDRVALLPSLIIAGLAVLTVYSFSQWVSQMMRTLTLAVVLAPIVSLFAVYWMIHCYISLGVPIAWLSPLALLPLIATWIMMPRFVDSRELWKNWMFSGGILLVTIMIPQSHVWVRLASADDMDGGTETRLMQEARQVSSTTQIGVYLSAAEQSRPKMTDSLEEIVEWSMDQKIKTPIELLPGLDRLRTTPDASASIDAYWQDKLYSRLQGERIRFETSPNPDDSLPRYASWLDAASLIVRAQRNSRTWDDHELADYLEIWLADALTSPSLNDYRDGSFFSAVVERLPSKTARRSSRRVAVLYSWLKFSQASSQQHSIPRIGTIYLYDLLKDEPKSLYRSLVDSRVDAIVETAITAVDDPGDLGWRRRMHRLTGLAPEKFETGPYGDRLRGKKAISLIRGYERNKPCRFWGMPWEDTIDQLASQLNKSDSAKRSQDDDEQTITPPSPDATPSSEEQENE